MKILRWLDEHFEEYILIALSAFTVIVIFLQVVMRYVFGNSLTWSEEVARYAFIWMIYMGISLGVKRDKHLKVDAFSMMFDKKGKIVLEMFVNVFFLAFAIIITYYGFDIAARVTRESAALQIPMNYVYLAPAVGMALAIIRLIQKFVEHAKLLKSADALAEEAEKLMPGYEYVKEAEVLASGEGQRAEGGRI